ncbi:hypothetical protein K7432_005300 [Basidiobolus ranarum]|uniref:Uncharacterized protein n=1 Tax=Basidiobolus ranarum TaxID=34480 RepID=A0ABR2W3C2_9FUNG
MNPTLQGVTISTTSPSIPQISPPHNSDPATFTIKEEFRPNSCPICKRCLTCPEGSLGVECKCLPQEVRWNRARLQNGFLDFRHKVIVANKPTGVMLIQWLRTKAGTRYNWGEEVTEVNICVRCNSHWMRFKKVANAHTVAECVTRLQAKYCGKCSLHPAGCYINGKRHVPLDSKLYHQWAQFVVNNQYSATEDFLPELFEVESGEATVPDMTGPTHMSDTPTTKRTEHSNGTPVQILPKKIKTEMTQSPSGGAHLTLRNSNLQIFSSEHSPSTTDNFQNLSYNSLSPCTTNQHTEGLATYMSNITTVSVRSNRKLYRPRVAITNTTTFATVLKFAIPTSPPSGLRIRVWNTDGNVEYMPNSLVIEAIKGVEHADLTVTLEPVEPVDFNDF